VEGDERMRRRPRWKEQRGGIYEDKVGYLSLATTNLELKAKSINQ